MKITKKKVFIFAVVAILVLSVMLLKKGCGNDINVAYEYEKLGKGHVRKTIAVTGVLQVIDLQMVMSKINGTVEKVFVDFNSPVKRGQLLAIMDSSSYDYNFNRLVSALETAKMRLSVADSELDGKKKMYKENLISQKAFEMAEIAYKTSYYDFKNIQNEYNMAKELKNSSRITSPLTGMVLTRKIEANQPVAAGAPLFEIVPTLTKMTLVINVDESDIGFVKSGQEVFFSVSAFPEKTFKGSIRQVRITPVASGALVTYQSVVQCDNSELLLKPGMTATATVVVGQKDDVLRVSNQAFNVTPVGQKERNTGAKVIFVKEGSKAVKREVSTGLLGDSHTEITGGKAIKVGDEILIKVRK